ncbi:TetR family transcriptional regulator [Sinirhodobacter populi]|uniref:TetR family transcriptional regulator n=2 Tax=Paenirhodobacter populi TaxID=2306993 RepID=A0A443J948_9RHOB|nr:TetR family transcriptional regulator [Sinirhodobacter populi]
MERLDQPSALFLLHTFMFVCKVGSTTKGRLMRRSKADAEQTRTSILDAAERLFCECGIAATPLERVARQAGVTRGALYWHFKDKSDLLKALRERYRLPQEDLIARAAREGHADPFGLLRDTAGDLLATFEAEESRQNLYMMLNAMVPDTESGRWLSGCNAEMFGLLQRLMEQAREHRMLTPDLEPQEAAVVLMITMNGLLTEWMRSGKAFSLTGLGLKIMCRQIDSLRAPAA